MTTIKPTVLVSFHQHDSPWKERLMQHLGILARQGLVDLWDESRILAGDDSRTSIENAVTAAKVAVILLSADLLGSRVFSENDVPLLLQRRSKEGLRLFPVLLRACDWQAVHWLRAMHIWPHPIRAITAGPDPAIDADFAALAIAIRSELGVNKSIAAAYTPAPSASLQRVMVSSTTSQNSETEREPLPGYEIIRVVHQGHYSRVYKVRSLLTREVCIVKRTERKRVSVKAIETLMTLRHPCIVSPQRFWQRDGFVYEELPYLIGTRLSDAVVRNVGGLAGHILVIFHCQIAGALAEMHRVGMIHRDIHPDNIFVHLSPLQSGGMNYWE